MGSLQTKQFVFSKPSNQTRSRHKNDDLGDFLQRVTPTYRWDWPHLTKLQSALCQVERGEIKRLMVFMPPRHGKSELCTVRFPVWLLARNPNLRVIVGAYNQILANKFSRKAMRIATNELSLADDRRAVEEWETTSEGGIRAVGVGSGVTGGGGNIILIDDPVKNREEANSLTYREKVWSWYTDDLYTRLEPGASIVLTMTRWHEDDLAGRILGSEDAKDWTVITFPAIAEENDALGRAAGEALCPDRYDLHALERIRKVLGAWSFAALYQQRPAPAEGGMFRRGWFNIVDAVPAENMRWVRWWDKAATSKRGDFSAGVLMGVSRDGIYYVADVKRGQWSSGERDVVMKQQASIDANTMRGPLEIWTEQEPGSGGKDSAQATIKLLAGYAVYAQASTGSKEVRALPLAAQAEAGNVRLLRGDWNAAYIDELSVFPFGAHDDQVDASSGAFNKLSLGTRDHGTPQTGGPRVSITRPTPTGFKQRPQLPGMR